MRTLLIFICLACAGNLSAQLSEKTFFENSSINAGVGLNWMLSDSVYNDNLGRLRFGYEYRVWLRDSFYFAPGFAYNVRGGKSFDANTYQVFHYLDFPLIIGRNAGNVVDLQGGFSFGYLTYNGTFSRGSRVFINPNPHPRDPYDFAFSGIVGAVIKTQKSFDFMIRLNANLIPYGSDPKSYRFLQVNTGITLNLGRFVAGFEKIAEERYDNENEFVELQKGCLVVLLSDKQKQAQYYRDRGEEDKAKLIEEDARQVNKMIVRAFQEHYDFSQVLFIYSNQMKDFKSFNWNRLFLNEELEYRAGTIESGTPVYYFKPGNLYTMVSGINREGYKFTDQAGNTMGYPFPQMGRYPLGSFDFEERVKKMNALMHQRFEEFTNRE